MDKKAFHLRLATPADIPKLQSLIDLSVRTLHVGDHSSAQIEGALRSVFGVDTQLIADGTYFVVEQELGGLREIVACGGWSRRKTLFGGDQAAGREDRLLDPMHEAAKIRAFFVHPDRIRLGIGSMILQACEDAAAAMGYKSFEMGATVAGERLYRQRGYQSIESLQVPLANGESLPVIRMRKCKPD